MTDLKCATCGFDASRWSQSDIERTLVHTEDLARLVVQGLSTDQLSRSDMPSMTGSATEPIVAVHELMHHLMELARWRRGIEEFELMTGVIVALHASGGGVPKQPIGEAIVGRGGVEGDVQSHRVHHGRPWQALCLYSVEVIDALRLEGHSIAAGSTGENLTIQGIDWSRMRGGLTIEIGDVRCRVSAPADPCSQIAQFFNDDDFSRIAHVDQPGWSRWYASVLNDGVINVGDTVVVSA